MDFLDILTLNGGSSSLKFSLYRVTKDAEECLLHGKFDRIGTPQSRLEVAAQGKAPRKEDAGGAPHLSHAVTYLLDHLPELQGRSLHAIGHRVVQGGPRHRQPEVVTDSLLKDLEQAVPLDPLHLPDELCILRTAQQGRPDLPHVVCFDTAFHESLPHVARLLPLSAELTKDAALQRYGFHGLSYEFILGELERLAGRQTAQEKIIIAHLGSGASMAAVVGGQCVETTMGFTPAAGLVMATRPGDMDPGVWDYLLRTQTITPEQLQSAIYRQSGLRGVSGKSGDVRDLLEIQEQDARARDALDLFYHQAKKCLGGLIAVLDGVKTLVFTGGIGEHAPVPRARICEALHHLGLRLDPALNQANHGIISTADSTVTVRVIPTNEEVVIARHTARLAQAAAQPIH